MANRLGATAIALFLVASPPDTYAQETGCAAGCPGLDLTAGYTADARRNTTGGLERGNALSGLLELNAAWVTDRLIPGALVTSAASLIHTSGGDITGRYVGDLQGLNNIEADGALRLYEFWSEIRFGGRGGMTTRLGFLDLNAEFDAPVTSAFFIGPPFGIGTDLAQTGENGPAVFPVTSLGIRLTGLATDNLLWRFAAFDAVPGHAEHREFATMDLSRRQGALLIGELEYVPRGFNKVAAGAWTYTARFAQVDGAARGDERQIRGNRGIYAMADRPLGAIGGTRLDGVLRAGIAAARFNSVNGYVGAAIVASHLTDSRPDDALGIAVAHARTGGAFRRQLAFDGGSPGRSETQVELTWRAPLAEWLSIASSAQWISSPGADRQLRDAFVVGIRFELSFGHHWALLAREAAPASDASLVMTSP